MSYFFKKRKNQKKQQTNKMDDSDIDRYIQESSRSYKECKIKNYARRSSLQKKTLGIDIERKLVSAQLNREEKQLREQLRQMQIDKKKNSMIHDMRGRVFICFLKLFLCNDLSSLNHTKIDGSSLLKK